MQAVYLGLAILIGGGLIFFGVGTGTNSGGALNAINQASGTANGLNVYNNKIKSAQQQIAKNPNAAAGYLALAQAKYGLATASDFNSTNNSYTDSGQALIAQAQAAWNKYLAIAKNPDVSTAQEMAQALLLSKQYTDAAAAQQIVTLANQSTASDWKLLAAYSYIAGQNDKGDLAAARAVSLTPKAQQATLKLQLAQYKKYGAQVLQPQTGQAQLPTG